MPNNHMSPHPSDNAPQPAGAPPAVAIHVHGWHVQVDVLPRLPRGLLIGLGAIVCSATGAWGVLTLLVR